jgi:DNA invertase Pin-like site-specific DNA recombinase
MVTKPKKVAIYARVSTDHQTTDNQVLELRAVAERHGWIVVAEFIDEGISGAKAKRPALDKMLAGVARRDFDMIAAWSVDRLGRSLQHLISMLGEIHGKKIDLYLHQQGVDTTTPGGKALFQMMGVFAEFERAMIQERVKAGLQRAKAQGKTLGRPSAPLKTVERIQALRADGMGILKIAKQLGIGTSVVQRIVSPPEARPI